MIIESEKAKELFCPFTFPAQCGDTNLNCEAEKCMAWESVSELTDEPAPKKGYCKLIEKGAK